MTARTPVVFVSGQFQQLQSGDSVALISALSITETVGITPTDGLKLVAGLAATAILNQDSPGINFQVSAWKSNATAAAQTNNFLIEAVAITGAAASSVKLAFRSQINGGGWTNIANLLADGTWNCGPVNCGAVVAFGSFTSSSLSAGSILFAGASGLITQNGLANFVWDDTNLRLGIGVTIPTNDVHIVSAAPTLRLDSSGTSFLQVQDTSSGRARLMKTVNSGAGIFDFDLLILDGLSTAEVRVFRSTTTAGVNAFDIFKGDGSGTINCRLSGNDNSFVCAAAGVFSIGVSSAIQITSGLLNKYNGITTVERGIPSNTAHSLLTAQGAAITATTLYAAPATGFYRINYCATITQLATTSCVLGGVNGFQVLFTSPNGSVVKTTPAGPTSATNSTATCLTGSIVVNAKTGTNIQYTMGYTSVGATPMQYELNAVVEAM